MATSKIKSDSIDTIAATKLTGTITPSTDAVTGAQIADNAINSEHYTDGSIDLAHMSSESVDEDNLHISNAGSNGQFLSKESGNAGGLTWADAGVTGLTNNSNTTWMTVSADEEITTPLQPSFQAYLDSTQSNKTGDATSYAITGAIWTEVKDTNADFSDGTFTAPVAGTYLFHGQVLLGGMGSGFSLHSMWISTSNRPYRAWHESDTANTSAEQGRSFCAVADMDASDTAYLTVKVSGGAKTVDILGTSSAQTTNFSGFLLG